MPTMNDRYQVMIPDELKEQIEELKRLNPALRHMSKSAICQMLIWRGIEEMKKPA